jgi:hypothetical protein
VPLSYRIREKFGRGARSQDVLAFLAITFAIVQFLDARDEEKGMSKIEGRIQRLPNDATTRSVGSFPTNLKNIIEMIGAAESSIRIVVDFPRYGIYSDPDLYGRYLEAMKAVAGNSGVEFKMVSYDKALTIEDTFPAMPTVADPKFARFVKDLDPVPDSVPALAEHLQARQAESIAPLEKVIKYNDGLQRRYLSERAPLFLWIIDDSEAVFAFKNLERNSETYSIRSCDDELVEHFIQYFELAFAHASKDYERHPTYTLKNVTGPLIDGGIVTFTGKYSANDLPVTVINMSPAPIPAK